MGMGREVDWSLYVVTDRALAGGRRLDEVVRAAIAGGATVIQLREKEAPAGEVFRLGLALRAITRNAGVPFIVNDRLDLALALEADGAHVGQDDLPAREARRLLGPGRILGVSVETVEQAVRAVEEGADYLGAGSVFSTATKPDAGDPIGLEGLARICRAVRVPVVAIGGINPGNAGEVIASGAAGVAVVSAVMAAPDVEATTRALRRAIDEGRLIS